MTVLSHRKLHHRAAADLHENMKLNKRIIVKYGLILTIIIPYSTWYRFYHLSRIVNKPPNPCSFVTTCRSCYYRSEGMTQHTWHFDWTLRFRHFCVSCFMLYHRVSRFTRRNHFLLFFSGFVVSLDIRLFSLDRHSAELCIDLLMVHPFRFYTTRLRSDERTACDRQTRSRGPQRAVCAMNMISIHVEQRKNTMHTRTAA